jgi:signal transduction histidine kinase
MDLITELDENSAVAVATLSDLINYDKIETKTFTIEKNDVNVWLVLERTIHPLCHQAKEKQIEMKLISQIHSPELFQSTPQNFNLKNLRLIGDSIKLGQVFRNLISNALKFTPAEGEIHIEGETLTHSFLLLSLLLLLSFLLLSLLLLLLSFLLLSLLLLPALVPPSLLSSFPFSFFLPHLLPFSSSLLLR